MMRLEIEGEEELEAEWRAAVDDLGRGLAVAAGRAAAAGAADVRKDHRFENRTGDLERSLRASSPRTSALGGEAEIAADAPHASFVDARLPFMKDAEDAAARVLETEAEEAVERAFKRWR